MSRVRHSAGIAVHVVSDGPTLSNCEVLNSQYGVVFESRGASYITNCNLLNNAGMAVVNNFPTTAPLVTAVANWWGTAAGPDSATATVPNPPNGVSAGVSYGALGVSHLPGAVPGWLTASVVLNPSYGPVALRAGQPRQPRPGGIQGPPR